MSDRKKVAADYIIYLFSIFKTIYFNFKYFPLTKAIKLPILVSKNVSLKRMKGKIEIKDKMSFGLIKIGFGDTSIFDRKRDRTIWDVSGIIVFDGKAFIEHGAKLSIHTNAVLEIGLSLFINSATSIVCAKSIKIGKNCLISWECIIIDTDFHKIFFQGNQINNDQKITIGDNVWIGMRSLILKGSSIPDGSVIAAGSIVTKPLLQSNAIYGETPAKLLKKDIEWKK